MSNNALTLFDAPKLSLPSHVASFFEEESNIENRVTVPTLSYEGKVWTISINGEKTKLMKRNDDGDEEPMSVMRVVILDYAKRRGRAYYEGAYDPAKPGSPVCWSDDGVTPHASVKEPPCGKCQDCPMAVKGSKVTEQGKAVTACSQHRMIVVVPANKPDFPPLRMKLAITSDWDKNSPELEAQGWFAFQNYYQMLQGKGVQHTAALVTKMRFDPNTAYPKVMFSPDRWLENAELAQIAPVVKSDDVKSLLAGTWTPAGADGVKIEGKQPSTQMLDDDSDDTAAQEAAAAEKAKAEAAAKKKADAEAKAAAKAAQEAAEAKAAANAKPATIIMDDDDDDVVIEAKPVEKKEAKPAKVSNDLPDDVADLLSEWGDD